MEQRSIFERIPCSEVDCPERVDCCTTVRWRISKRDYNDQDFREWWLLHEGARIYEEDREYWIQWPMRCKNASDDGLSCLDYENRPLTCRMYACRRMTGLPTPTIETNAEECDT